ncbi:PucR family transcriptional regulator [Saccharothrix syringae]|uniref:PucR family transcriptional regulator n=2 Tax=Saccharothrix syringae TaxID=103733 RepID=A0A5Q0HET1_SACSY|nr:PucR family transcriptional regulator [Saccharothrix syringae]
MASDDRVLDELVLAARTHSPEVARLPEAENRRHVQVLLAAGLDSLARPEHPDDQDFATAEALGADRAAQGVPITGLLRGVQAGRTRAVRIAIDRSRAAGVPDDVILEAVLDLDRYTGALERHIVNGYHHAELQLSRTTRDVRTQLLRALLLPGAADPPAADDLHQAGLRPGGRYYCLVSDVTDPALARALEQRLLGLGGVYGLVEGRLTGLAAKPPGTDDLAPAVLLIAAPAVPLTGLRDVHALCTAALAIAARQGLRGVHHLVELAAETALAAQPLLADLLTDALLTRLDPADDFHRELACTALAYLDHGHRLGHTAVALHLHPNTVRYRLDRLAEITALPLGEDDTATRSTVPDTLRSWWALRTWLARARG